MHDKEKNEIDCRVIKLKEGAFNCDYGYKHFLEDIFGITYSEDKIIPISTDKKADVIYLDDEFLLGIGDNRSCYAFPFRPDRCIKVEKKWNTGLYNSPKQRVKRTFMRWLADFSSNREEARFYLNKVQKLGGNLLLHLPHCYGTVQTNLGQGLVFERIRNNDGGYSKQIDIFLKENQKEVDRVLLLIDDLLTHLLGAGHSLFAWNAENLLVKLDPIMGDRLVVIDWKSHNRHNNDLPFTSFVHCLRMLKMIKEANGFKQRILDSLN